MNKEWAIVTGLMFCATIYSAFNGHPTLALGLGIVAVCFSFGM